MTIRAPGLCRSWQIRGWWIRRCDRPAIHTHTTKWHRGGGYQWLVKDKERS